MDNSLMLRPVRFNESSLTDSLASAGTLLDSTAGSRNISSDRSFIEANTIECIFNELRENHVIPVFIKDNEPVISHADFIESTGSIISEVFSGERILKPAIRLSHPVKDRIPDAKGKPAGELLDHEKTLYYERMAFVIEIPSIQQEVNGNLLSLTIGGVKAYNLDNLYSRKGTDEHFKIFIGFQNKVCTNMCVWSDGALLDLKVSSIGQLKASIRSLLTNYDQQHHLYHLRDLGNYSVTEKQLAQLIGRCRMYQHLPQSIKGEVSPMFFGDQQMNMVVRDFYRDRSFGGSNDGNIDLWRLYNLFTGANKSTYIDQFLERGTNAFSFVYNVKQAIQQKAFNWYLS